LELTSDLKAGQYRLVVRILDRESGVLVTRERAFRVQ
jgi:mRNA-degrading endonuclease RelE of RelBE toxin-antitoxin system